MLLTANNAHSQDASIEKNAPDSMGFQHIIISPEQAPENSHPRNRDKTPKREPVKAIQMDALTENPAANLLRGGLDRNSHPQVDPVKLQEFDDAFTQTGRAKVASVIDPLRIRLDDGRIFQLSALRVPGMDANNPSALSLETQAYLATELTGKDILIYQTKDEEEGRVNRFGYHLAHIIKLEGHLWVQEALLDLGLARVFPHPQTTARAKELIAAEKRARNNKLGFWGTDDAENAYLKAEDATRAKNGLAIIEGTIKSTAPVKSRVYLNFGADWRTDFTIGIDRSVEKLMNDSGVNPLSLGGKTVRVHGWVENYNGPFVELSHPAWLEIINDGENE